MSGAHSTPRADKASGEASTGKRFSNVQSGRRIVVTAAFLLSCLSWWTTMNGMTEFVLTDSSNKYIKDLEAGLLSFSVQSILFILSLFVVSYIRNFWRFRDPIDGELHYTCKRRFKRFVSIVSLVTAWAITLSISSGFSFVYFTQEIQADTKFPRDSAMISNISVELLDEAEQYISLAMKEIRSDIIQNCNSIIISNADGTTESELSPEEFAAWKDDVIDDVEHMVLPEAGDVSGPDQNHKMQLSSKQEGNIGEVQEKVRNFIRYCSASYDEYNNWTETLKLYSGTVDALHNANHKFVTAYNGYRNHTETEDKKSDKADAIADNLPTLGDNVTKAGTLLKNALRAMHPATKDALTHDLLGEMLKPEPDIEQIKAYHAELVNTVIGMGYDQSNYTELVSHVDQISTDVSDYCKLLNLLHGDDSEDNQFMTTEELRKELVDNPIMDPDIKDNNSIEQWHTRWKDTLRELQRLLRSLPVLNLTDQGCSLDPKEAASQVDELVRNYTTSINPMEYAALSLSTDASNTFLSRFALFLSFAIDLMGVVCGVLSYYMVDHKKRDKTGSRKTADHIA